MKRIYIILIACFICQLATAQEEVISDTITIDSSGEYEEEYTEDALPAPGETAYSPYFLQDSLSGVYTSKSIFKNDLQKEYKRLAEQLEEGKPKKADDRNIDWITRFIEMFPTLDGAVVLAVARIVIYGLIVFIFFYIIKFFFYKDINWNPFKKKKDAIAQEKSSEAESSEHGYENKINNALSRGDKRLAVRYYYLWLLYKLDAYNHIKFHPEKTNSQYLYELKNARYIASFANLSYIYDYMWYGEAELNDTDFNRVRDNFDMTLRQII